MNNFTGDVLVCAHTHIPSCKKFDNKLYINVGSVGKPKIGRPNCTYALIDISDDGEVNVSIREIEYEFKRIVKDCTMLNLPNSITHSYESGQE